MAAEYEKKEFKAETDSSEHNASHIPAYNHNEEYYDDGVETSRWTRMGVTPSSFKRRTLADKNNQLNRSLKSRHLHMIAIGGSIGAGFFVASGNALRTGGPGSLLICFAIIGIMMFNVVYALGEMAVLFPVSGGFYTYSIRFIDPSWGFAMGWNYVLQWLIVLPLELTVAGLTIRYWDQEGKASIAVWITLFLFFIIIISVFGVLGYAEEEFWVALLKLATIVIFMLMGIVFACGGGPRGYKYDEYWGARLFYDPGAFNNGFFGFCSVFVTAAFAFSGTELVGLAAAETANPQKSLPGAIKQIFWRITLFYILGLFFIGLLVAYNDERLLGSGLVDVSASPFVIVAVDAGIPRFGDFINVVILLSVISIGLSGVYGGSRTLTALAEQDWAPKIFSYVDRAGRPLFSTIFIIMFAPIAYISLAATGTVVFEWLLALSGLAALFTWGSICLAHIRFRAAWKHNGHTLDELPFQAIFGVYGSYLGLCLVLIVLVAQFYTAIKPLDVESFFKAYLAIFVVALFYIVGVVWKRQTWIPIHKIDINTGRREIDWEAVNKEKIRRQNQPAWRRVVHKLF